MGSSLSCLDPSREQQPHSWPKDHPGRAEAIAEYKARRSSGKFTRKPLKTDVAKAVPPVVASKEVPVVEPVPKKKEEVVEPKTSPEDNTELEPKPDTEVKDVSDVNPMPVIDTDEITPVPAVEKEDAPVVEEKKAPVEEIVADPASETTAEEPPAPSTEEEAPPPAPEEPAEATPVEPKEPIVEPEEPPKEPDSDPRLASEPTAEALVDSTPDRVIATENRPVSPSIDARRAIFENTPDSIPEVSKLALDVKDPVTGEFVTLVEYRKRQKERAQGVVKEQVDKYEAIDEEAMKEAATVQLQLESRAHQTVRSWSKPDNTSAPSSPISPSKKGTLDLPFGGKAASPKKSEVEA